MVVEGLGYIDTTPSWDEDGRCYLVNGWANSRIGFNGVLPIYVNCLLMAHAP